jgi:hypothetical protein
MRRSTLIDGLTSSSLAWARSLPRVFSGLLGICGFPRSLNRSINRSIAWDVNVIFLGSNAGIQSCTGDLLMVVVGPPASSREAIWVGRVYLSVGISMILPSAITSWRSGFKGTLGSPVRCPFWSFGQMVLGWSFSKSGSRTSMLMERTRS